MQRQYPLAGGGGGCEGVGDDGETYDRPRISQDRGSSVGTAGRPTSSSSASGGWSSWVNPAAYMHSSGEPREKGAKRKMIASYLKAANEVRQNYTSGYFSDRSVRKDIESVDADGGGAWTDTEMIHNGREEMIVFPSYARRRSNKPGGHNRSVDESGYTRHHQYPDEEDQQQQHDVEAFNNDDSQEQWQLPEFVEQKPMVDVDVRGWIFYPHNGPLTRKQRIWMGMARQMCGLPSQGRGVTKEDQEAAKEAERALARDSELAGRESSRPSSSEGVDPRATTPEPGVVKRLSWKAAAAVTGSSATPMQSNIPLTGQELDTAHGFLKTRLAPFMARPTPHLPVTLFFYNSKTSQSRTILTNEFGQFSIRAGLPFVPTHVRVLASEKLHETEEIQLLEPHGISLISDIDDTIKHSAVSMGAREMFRNTFIRDLNTLVIPGVKELYNTLNLLEVPIHYVSNSPWQLYPLLSQYFSIAGLPKGSFHLKQYSGMLQGIFEPVAERKKANLERILKDFPERRFILVGDSGEADLEVYSEIALGHPGRIRAIFIRDITTKEDFVFFSENRPPSDGRKSGISRSGSSSDLGGSSERPPVPPRPDSAILDHSANDYREPAENLIDFSSSDEEGPEELKPMEGVSMYPTTGPQHVQRQGSISSVSSRSSQLKSPPPLPKKPSELKGSKLPSSHDTPQPREMVNVNAIGSGNPPASALGVGGNYDRLNSSTGGGIPPQKPPKPPSLFDSAKESEISGFNRHHSANDVSELKVPPPPPPRRKANTWNEHQPTAPSSAIGRAIAPTMAAAAAPALHDKQKLESVVPSPLAPPKPKPANTTTMLRRVAAGNQSSQSLGRPSAGGHSYSYSGGGGSGGSIPPQTGTEAYDPASGIEKKVWLWNQRWERARESMEAHGVLLKKWRKGTDVLQDAVSVVQEVMTGADGNRESP